MRGLYAITHWGHTLLVIVLIITGALIFFPDARLFIFRGYSLVFSHVHRYSGALYVPITCAFIAIAIKNGKTKNKPPTLLILWKSIHIKLLGVTTLVFALSGFALWLYSIVAAPILDISALAHQIFTLILLITFLIHLISVKNNLNNGVKND